MGTKPNFLGNSSLTTSVIDRGSGSYSGRNVTVTNYSTANTNSVSLVSQLQNKINNFQMEKKSNNHARHPFVEQYLIIRLPSHFV